MEVMVTDKGITMNSLQGGSTNNNMLATKIGATMKLDNLIKLLRTAACDVFPDDDAFCYTESSCEKNYVMEMHIYACMACFALSHNFAWSRWNLAAGSRTCVFLMRELQEMRKLVRIPWNVSSVSLPTSNLSSQINQQFMLHRSRPVSSTARRSPRPTAQPRCLEITPPTPITWWFPRFSRYRRPGWTPSTQFCGKTFSNCCARCDHLASAE